MITLFYYHMMYARKPSINAMQELSALWRTGWEMNRVAGSWSFQEILLKLKKRHFYFCRLYIEVKAPFGLVSCFFSWINNFHRVSLQVVLCPQLTCTFVEWKGQLRHGFSSWNMTHIRRHKSFPSVGLPESLSQMTSCSVHSHIYCTALSLSKKWQIGAIK